MAVNPIADQDLITTYFNAQLSQTIYDDGVPDPADMSWVNNVLLPYVVIEFGMPVGAAEGRSIAVEQKQPTVQRVGLSVVSSNAKFARQVGGKVSEIGVGFTASSNVGPLRFIGGSSFTLQVESRPNVYVSQIQFTYLSNMSNV